MLKDTTYVICIITKANEILLQHRIYEPNAGKWNAPGGKVNPWETLEEACIREVYEETSLNIVNPKYVSTIIYEKLGPVTRIAVFAVSSFSGEPKSSSEGKITWIPIEHLNNLKHNLASNLEWFIELALQSKQPPREYVY